MIFFVQSTPPPKLKTKATGTIGLFLAAILLLMAIGQIFNYEGFVSRLASYNLPASIGGVAVLAAGIIFMELVGLLFLTRRRLSPAMRFVSMVLGWIVLVTWLFLDIWLNLHAAFRSDYAHMSSTALFGAIVSPAAGLWSVFFEAALIVLAAWAAWGMWPFPLHRK